jgi:hypothetical protein
MNIRKVYKSWHQAVRANESRVFGCFDTCLYWAQGNIDLARRLYVHQKSEVDALWVRARRLKSGGKLTVKTRSFDGSKFLTVR